MLNLASKFQYSSYFPFFAVPTELSEDNPEERRFPIMRDYEVVFIVHPDLDENALKGIVERVQSWITDSGGSIVKLDQWGKRRMAYSIRKQREGQYIYVEAQFAPGFSAELERNLRFLEPVMRFSIIAKQA
jgi:small subunit ribosomal protein S6